MRSSFAKLCLLAGLGGVPYNANAQLSTLPKRYRHAYSHGNSQVTSDNRAMGASPTRVERRQLHSESKITVKRKARELSWENDLSLSTSLQSAAFELSISMPSLEELEFGISSMSLFLEQAELSLSLSLPMFEDLPTKTLNNESDAETVSIGRNNASSTLILCSFIAGLSALVVGATAMFLKMQRVHARELEQSEPRHLYDV